MRCTELTLMPMDLGHRGGGPVRRLAGRIGQRDGDAPAAATSAPSGGMRDGRVLSRSRPSTPVCHEALLPAPDDGLARAGAGA